jgi:hypothetical protein
MAQEKQCNITGIPQVGDRSNNKVYSFANSKIIVTPATAAEEHNFCEGTLFPN